MNIIEAEKTGKWFKRPCHSCFFKKIRKKIVYVDHEIDKGNIYENEDFCREYYELAFLIPYKKDYAIEPLEYRDLTADDWEVKED